MGISCEKCGIVYLVNAGANKHTYRLPRSASPEVVPQARFVHVQHQEILHGEISFIALRRHFVPPLMMTFEVEPFGHEATWQE